MPRTKSEVKEEVKQVKTKVVGKVEETKPTKPKEPQLKPNQRKVKVKDSYVVFTVKEGTDKSWQK